MNINEIKEALEKGHDKDSNVMLHYQSKIRRNAFEWLQGLVEEVESLRKAKLVTDQQWRELVEENERLELDRNDWKDQAEKEYRRFREIDQEHMETKGILHDVSKQNAELAEVLRHTQTSIQKNLSRWNYKDEVSLYEAYMQIEGVLRKYGLEGKEE